MTGISEWGIERSRPSFSFYFTAHKCKTKPDTVRLAARLADSLTIAGSEGPKIARQLRTEGLNVPVRFDGTGYAREARMSASEWIQLQRDADATELLLPGSFVAWNKDDDAEMALVIRQQGQAAGQLGASALFAIDSRWLSKGIDPLLASLQETECPVALILAHPADPLSTPAAVGGLRRLCKCLPNLSLLRTDHGAIGALAFGAQHASMGLTTSTRHYVPPRKVARRRPSNSARLFDRLRLDWFLVDDIAAWESAHGEFVCHLPCCQGQSLARFLDSSTDVDIHNMTALGDFADHIINVNQSDRPTAFLNSCQIAVSHYKTAGFRGPENPKAQLTAWAFS